MSQGRRTLLVALTPSVAGSARPWLDALAVGLRSAFLTSNGAVRRMAAAGLISAVGDRLQQVAMATLILSSTGSVLQAGLVFVVSTVPYALFGPLAGAYVDRWDRRTAMVGADLARAVLVLLMPFAAQIELMLVYLLVFAMTCATVVFEPAQQAALPDVVPPEELGGANVLFRTTLYLSDLIGYPLAAVLVITLVAVLGDGGLQLVFGLDSLSFVLSAFLLWRLPTLRARLKREATSIRAQMIEGLQFVRAQPFVRTNTILFTVGPLWLGSLHTLWIGFAWRVSGTDAVGFATTEVAFAVGTLLGLAALPGAMQLVNKGRLVVAGFLLMGAAASAVGFTTSLGIAASLATAAGIGNMLFLIPSLTLVQQQTPTELRGRVIGVRSALTYSAFAASNGVAGYFSESVGVSPLFVVLGGAMALTGAIALLVPSARDAP